MVDANGNSGGVLTDVYSVAGTSTGSNASCLVSQSATLSTTTNATSQLNTCDNIQISIKNGQKPYTITVAETNTPASFNTTMGSNDDTYMWVNNLSPGQQVIGESSRSRASPSHWLINFQWPYLMRTSSLYSPLLNWA